MILAIVITYFPEKELLERNLEAFVDEVDKVLIWENTPLDKKLVYRFINHTKVEYCGDGINSISHALNYAWRYAEKNGYDYILTMDQDSVFYNFSVFLKMTVYNERYIGGIWSPNVVTDITKVRRNGSLDVEERYNAVTSGMLLRLSLIAKVGGWNESFVIDGVDDEFCFRSSRYGEKVFRFMNVFLIQKYGNPQSVSIGPYSYVLRNDSVARLYSIYKSIILLIRMYPEQVSYKQWCRAYWGKRVKWILLFEDNGFKKVYSIVKGIISGFFCKLPIKEI